MPIRQPDRPPIRATRPHLPLMRAPKGALWKIAITCWEILQVETHFMGRRTLPCVDEDCPGCRDQKPRRYEAYLSGVLAGVQKHILVALTPRAANDLLTGVIPPNQLRGHIIILRRTGTRPNGPLSIEVTEEMLDANRLPPAPDLLAQMLDIWGLNQSHQAMDDGAYAQAVKRLAESQEESTDAQPDESR